MTGPLVSFLGARATEYGYRDMVCTAGLDGYFKQPNGMWSETLGWSDAELRSHLMITFVHPDDRQATLDERAWCPSGGRPSPS